METDATATQPQSAQISSAPPPALDLESTPVAGQIASAVLDAKTGAMVDDGGRVISEHNASILYQMLLETGQLQQEIPVVRRMTVMYNHTRYIVARDETHVYIVQARV